MLHSNLLINRAQGSNGKKGTDEGPEELDDPDLQDLDTGQ